MIEVSSEAGCVTLRINRADKANSLTEEMLRRLADALMAVTSDTRVVILTGAGDKVFSAGADLEEAKNGSLATSPMWEVVSGAVANLPCLTIAALNGTLAGGAFGMALACDMRISASHAKFFYPVAKLGFLPQPSDPGRMTRLIGPARAKMILAAGQKIVAEEALMWGLLDELTDAPYIRACQIADGLAEADPTHIAAIKAMVP